MRAIFIGCVESSKILLNTLLNEKADIVGVITKKESNFNSDFADLSNLSKINNIPYLYVEDINDIQTYRFINDLNPDIGFCLGWSQLLKKELLNMFSKGVIGFHPAALPHNRGRHPLIWALVLGLEDTASSFFMLEEGADTGRVVSQVSIQILYEDTARTLYDKVMETAKVQLINLWQDICNDRIHVVSEGDQIGNIWRKRNKNDGRVDWRMSSRSIYNLVRALSEPYVGAHFEYNGCEYKIWKTRELEDDLYNNIEPGKIVGIREDGTFIVKAGSGLIELVQYDRNFEPQIGIYL